MIESQTIGYDIIGDVHGQADRLEGLLGEMGYAQTRGVYEHPSRTAVFVGDLIDRGPQQRRTVEVVMAMVDQGGAHIVMGNHEFNAIAWHHGWREDSEKNRRQHQQFLDQIPEVAERDAITQWFLKIPMWLELRGLRIIHACWDPPSMKIFGGNPILTLELVKQFSDEESPVHDAIEVLIKGPEDKNSEPQMVKGHKRSARIEWWLQYQDESPVIFGHYWGELAQRINADHRSNALCVDYSTHDGDGPLAAYRWDGEAKLDPQKIVIFTS